MEARKAGFFLRFFSGNRAPLGNNMTPLELVAISSTTVAWFLALGE